MSELKKIVGTEKLVLGSDRTLKLLKKGKIDRVFIASNAPENVRADIKSHGKLAGVTVEELDVPNEEVGILCKKPFPVAVASRLK